MRHRTPLAIVTILALVTLSCSLTGGLTGQEEPEATQPSAQPGGERPAPPSGFTWDDIPVYPGASIRGDIVSDSAAEALYETVEVRLYETQDGIELVDSFYLDEMPKHGWRKVVHDCRNDICMSTWFKGDGEIHATLKIGVGDDGETVVGISRAERRK